MILQLWKRITALNLKQLLHVIAICFKRPLLIVPTLKASKKAMQIAQKHYGNAQHKNGKPNAFRHALWNILLAKLAYKNNDYKYALLWAKDITTLHETLAPNAPLETAMDLHNNAIGRLLFSEVKTFSEDNIIQFLKDKTEDAVQITNSNDIKNHPNVMVYL